MKGYLLAVAMAFAVPIAAQPATAETGKPPLSIKRLAGEFLAGNATAFVGGVIGSAVGITVSAATSSNRSSMLSLLDMGRGGLIGLGAGWALGSSIGVYKVGTLGDQTGSYLATVAGGVAIPAAAFGIAAAVGNYEFMPLAVLLSAPGAMVGFNRTRRYDAPLSPDAALLEIEDGRIVFGSPAVGTRASPIDGATRRDLSLVRVRF